MVPLIALGVILYRTTSPEAGDVPIWPDDPPFKEDLRPHWLYCVTVTRPSPVQLTALARISQAIQSLSEVRWIVVEDAIEPTPSVEAALAGSGVENYKYLQSPASPWPYNHINQAFYWIRTISPASRDEERATVVILSEDQTYSAAFFQLLRGMRKAKAVAWPIGTNRESRELVNLPWNATTRERLPRWYPRFISGFGVHSRLLLRHKHTELVNVSPHDLRPRTEAKAVGKFLENLLVKPRDLRILGSYGEEGKKFDVHVWREPL